MSETTTPIDVASIKPGQLVSGRFTNGGTFTDVPVELSSSANNLLILGAYLRYYEKLGGSVAEITNVRDPRPAWADDPTAILIDEDQDLYYMIDGEWFGAAARWHFDELVRMQARLFGHRVAEDES